MRSIRFHTYHGRPQPEGALYLAHEEEIENILILRFAIREPPPPTAVRERVTAAPLIAPPAPPSESAPLPLKPPVALPVKAVPRGARSTVPTAKEKPTATKKKK